MGGTRAAVNAWTACLVIGAAAAVAVGCAQERPTGTVFPDVPTAQPVPAEYHVDFAPGERALCDEPPLSERLEAALQSDEVGSVLPRPQNLAGVPGSDPKELYERWQELSVEDRLFHLCANEPTQ